MEFQRLSTTKRERSGKGPARRLRRQGLIPAILYGKGVETMSLSLEPRALIKALSGSMRMNTILSLEIQGSKEDCTAIVRDHQYDPVSRALLHVDLYAVKLDQKIEVQVPLVLTGRSQGEQLGGTLVKLVRTVPLACYPADIPEAIVADISSLDLHATLAAVDLIMPENVDMLLEGKTPLASVAAKRAETPEAGAAGAADGDAAKSAKSDTPAS